VRSDIARCVSVINQTRNRLFVALRRARSRLLHSHPNSTLRMFLLLLYRPLHRWLSPAFLDVSVYGLSVRLPATDDVILESVIREGHYQPFFTQLFVQSCQPGMTVVDVGAHVGLYTLLAARRVLPHGRVFAFEPDPDNFALLELNTRVNNLSWFVTARKIALGNEEGIRPLYRDVRNSGCRSFNADNVAILKDSISAEVTTLGRALSDHGCSKVDLIKVDVEGAEGLVFAGAWEVLESNPLSVFLEFWPTGMTRMGSDPFTFIVELMRRGFVIHAIEEGKRILVPITDPVEAVKMAKPAINLLVRRGA